MRFFRMFFLLCCLVPSVSVLVAGNPTVINLSPDDNWFDVLNGDGIAPGTEVVLSEGTYSINDTWNFDSSGTAENPIVIRSAEGANVLLQRTSFTQNLLNIGGSQYVTFRGLTLDRGSAGIRVRRKDGRQPTSLIFEDLVIRNMANGGFTANEDGTTYDEIILRRNEITDVGGLAGVYLGCNNASGGATACVFKNGLVEENYIHDIGRGVGDGIQIKDGSYNNIIRDNVVFTNAFEAGSVGILVYGTDGNARNIIEGNVVGASGDNAIQASSEATIRNNIVFSSGPDFAGIGVQTLQSAVPGNLTIVNNTVFSEGGDDVLDVQHYGQTYSGPIIVANNALYMTESPASLTKFAISITGFGAVASDRVVVSNVGVGPHMPSYLGDNLPAWDPNGNLSADFGSYALMDAFPIAGSKLIGAGDVSYQPEVDFNGVSRSGTNDIGAYVYDPNGNPGWAITLGFKELLELSLGDFDNDGDVDGADFLKWQRDGLSATDLTAWEANFGTAAQQAAASTSVPEPSTGLMITLCCGVCAMRRSRRS